MSETQFQSDPSIPSAAPQDGPLDTVDALEERLSRPTQTVVELFAELEGDLILLGVGGKMGPTLARMARRAVEQSGMPRRVFGVSRFSDPNQRDKLQSCGVETITGDLLDPDLIASLPEAAHVIYMAGMKFGASGNESLTWAMNTLLPERVCRKYAKSRIAAFSTGNVYGMTPICLGGSIESDPPAPVGEYAMSCLGRERAFEHHSRTAGTPISLLRLNYACELRYGVLVDLALKVQRELPIDLSMGMANVIWQGDANAMALLSLREAASPPTILNLAGPEQLSVRRLAEQLGQRLGRPPVFTGQEQPAAILSNGQKAHQRFGYPTVPIFTLMDWVAHWVKGGGETLGKPTKFEVRNGKF